MGTVGEGRFDVIVVGAGNAALCAALAAREEGARVLALEKAPFEERGGNSAFSGGLFRLAHHGLEDVLALVPDLTPEEVAHLDMGPFPPETYYDELMRLSEGRADPELTRVVVDQSYDTLRWMQQLGVRFELYQRAPRKGDRVCFQPGNELQAWGGGGGLMQQLFRLAERQGVAIAYNTAVTGLLTDDRGGICGVRVRSGDGLQELEAEAVVLVGLLAIAGSLIVSYSRARAEAAFGRAFSGVAGFLGARDLRLLLVAVGSVLGQGFPVLVAVALMTNVTVVARLVVARRMDG